MTIYDQPPSSVIPKTNATELETLHRQWLETPITRQLKRLLDAHAERIVDLLCTASRDTTEEGQLKLSQLAVQLNTTRTLTKMIYDTNLFTQNSARALDRQ